MPILNSNGKRVASARASKTSTKRYKPATPPGTVSQPVLVDTQPSPLSRLSPRKALTEASQQPTFESLLRETQPEEAIASPTEGSEEATAALLTKASDATEEIFDRELQDNFNSIVWTRLKKYIIPLTTQKAKKSWVYRHGYRVALKKDPSKLYFPAFRELIAAANLDAEAALWASHYSVARYVMRLYEYIRPRVVKDVSEAFSKIHISFNGWTTKGGKRGFLGIVAHYVNKHGDLIDLPIALPQLQFNIDARKIGYFVLDNASNNDTAALLWGKNSSAYNNDASELPDEDKFMRGWRREGPLSVLLDIITHIKTPQQYAQFARFQQLAHRELPADALADARKILEPVKPVVTRWNSYYACFERTIKLQSAVNARNNKIPDAQAWMRTDGLSSHNWAVITEYMDALAPLKKATKRLEGRSKQGGFGAIAEIIPDRVKSYEDVNYNAHDEAPEDHFAINLNTAWAKLNDYYEKLDDTPIYYTATLLHPYYATYCEQV
ncbi:hypothetical protein L13192_05225 [Pyrenophora tritici-repentis]|nr:hypothetical protein L13192_05225 [Pyrenophora tritici-repentis]